MPTAARLIAALGFVVIGLGVARVLGLLPIGWAIWGGVGALCGWVVMGTLTGRGYRAAAGFGLRTSATLAFWALLALSLREMIRRAYLRQYDDAFEAIVAIFEIALDRGRALITAEPLAVLVVGGLVVGVLSEFAGRRWK